MSEENAKPASEKKPTETKPLDAVRKELVKSGAMVIKGKS